MTIHLIKASMMHSSCTRGTALCYMATFQCLLEHTISSSGYFTALLWLYKVAREVGCADLCSIMLSV